MYTISAILLCFSASHLIAFHFNHLGIKILLINKSFLAVQLNSFKYALKIPVIFAYLLIEEIKQVFR